MELVSCPECEHYISNRAASCPQCGFPVATAASPTAVLLDEGDRRLFEIAYRQKLLIYVLIPYVLTQFPIMTMISSGWLGILALTLVLINVGLEVWCVYKLGRAVGLSLPAILLFSVGVAIPCVAWVVLLIVNALAIAKLRAAGVPVGLMGANLEAI